MKKTLPAIAILAALALAAPGQAATRDSLVRFYKDYLTLVSASDYVTVSRDEPETWDSRFDAIARNAGFEDSAAAIAAGEAMGADSEIAGLRQAVAEKILQQYKPYRE